MPHHRSTLACVLSVALASPALGASNLSFETGDLTGWDVHGVASVEDDSFVVDPAHGTYQAKVLSSPNGQLPGTLASNVGIDLAVFDAWSMVPPEHTGDGEPGEMHPLMGSAITQEIFLGAGGWVSFDYHFVTEELPNSHSQNDFAFAALVGPGGSLVDGFVLADTFDVVFDMTWSVWPYSSLLPDGYQSAQLLAGGATGMHRLVFGVFDASWEAEDVVNAPSAVLIDNVSISGDAQIIPLPAAAWSGLALLGCLMVPAVVRRHRLARRAAA